MDTTMLLEQATAYRDGGWRLALINATAILPDEALPDGGFDVTWSFARGASFEHIRARVLPGEEVPSISRLFGGAFLFENELRELFGINVTGIALDLHGQLYQTAERVPFSPSAIRARIEQARPPAEAKPKPAPRSTGAPIPAEPKAAEPTPPDAPQGLPAATEGPEAPIPTEAQA